MGINNDFVEYSPSALVAKSTVTEVRTGVYDVKLIGGSGQFPNPVGVVAIATAEVNSTADGDNAPSYATTSFVTGNGNDSIEYLIRTFTAYGTLAPRAFNLMIMTP